MAVKIIWELLLFNGHTDHKEMLAELYTVRKMGLEDIGDLLGINKIVVRNELAKLGIEIRPKGRPRFRTDMITQVAASCATFATMTITRRAIKK